MKLYISTLALKSFSIQDVLNIAEEKDWAIEFSSGIPYNKNIKQFYKNAIIKRIPHNYFPAPKTPFVLNLASSNQNLRNKSISHCKNGLLLAKHSNAPFYSAHAGFCIDPNPEELGKKLPLVTKFEKKKNLDLFVESLNEVLDFALELNLDFLIENNVIAKFNLVENKNPLLCTNSDEIIDLFDKINRPNFHLLLDTGHLKVSSITLRRNVDVELNKIKKYIKAIHHSDNDGLSDSNEMLDETYWFRNYISTFSNLINVLEVNTKSISDIESQINLLYKWM